MIGEMEETEREKERHEKTERVTGEDARGEKRSEKEHIVVYSRGTREINGSRNRQKPVRGQKTRCRHRLNRHRAIRRVRRKEEKKKESYGRSARRERVKMEERLTQEEEKRPGDSDGRGR